MYKDYTDDSKQKLMTLEATEFLRRFCLHILPPGFRKIRYYGFLANTNRILLQAQQREMGAAVTVVINKHWKTITKEKMDYDVDECPCCKKGKMITILHFNANAPPPAILPKFQNVCTVGELSTVSFMSNNFPNVFSIGSA